MDLIKLGGGIQKDATIQFVNCRFTVTVGSDSLRGEDDDQGFPVFTLPAAPRPLIVRIHLEPSEPTTHAIDADFTISAEGLIAPATTTKTPDGETRDVDLAEFLPPRAIHTKNGHVFLVTFVVSRIRDATQHTLNALLVSNGPRMPRPENPRPATWAPQPVSLHAIGDPPVASGSIAFASSSPAPVGEQLVLELKLPSNRAAPHYLAVFWPDALARDSGAGPAPLLVYFHAAVSQNVQFDFYERPRDEMNQRETYPDGWDYLFYGLFRYFQYSGDPFRGGDAPYTKGIPHQIAMSQKNCVAILPEHSAAEEIGALMSGDTMLSVLSEITAYMFRRKGTFRSPGVGRTGLAAFSSGNNLVTSFLAANQGSSFCTSVLKEVYMFDAPMGVGPNAGKGMNRWVAQVLAWLQSGPSAQKVARAYVQQATQNLAQTVVGLGQPPTVAQSADGRIAVSILPASAWAQAIRANGSRPDPTLGGFNEAHQMISSVLLTDALRRSAF